MRSDSTTSLARGTYDVYNDEVVSKKLEGSSRCGVHSQNRVSYSLTNKRLGWGICRYGSYHNYYRVPLSLHHYSLDVFTFDVHSKTKVVFPLPRQAILLFVHFYNFMNKYFSSLVSLYLFHERRGNSSRNEIVAVI